jgi:ubiquinone/menaquinone biosynthesis C-methylase UbiE
MRTTDIVVLSFGLLLAMPGLTAAQTRSPAPVSQGAPGAARTQPTERREDWQRAPDIFAALGVGAGSRVADLGSGQGWLTTRLAKAVGATGRVFASDIDPGALRTLAGTLARETIQNVELVLAEDDDPRLPFESLDGVVVVNAYHEMTKRVAVLDGIKRALVPGGKLVIVENTPHDTAFVTRKQQTEHHVIAIDFVRDDLEAQGFEILSVNPTFIDRKEGDHSHRQWMIVARVAPK